MRREAEPSPGEPATPPAGTGAIEVPEELKRRQQPLEDLLAGLERYLAQEGGAPAQKLEQLFAYWGLAADEMRQTHLEADLDGDGRPDILWYSTSMGAHTASTNVYVSSWAPGGLTVLPGEMYSTNVERLAVEGSDILLTGGTISSAGAGGAQRVADLLTRAGAEADRAAYCQVGAGWAEENRGFLER